MLCNVKGGSFTVAKVNEDSFGYDTHCAWVLDGSTGLNGKRLVAAEGGSDAQWYSSAFSEFLKNNLPQSEETLPALFSRGVKTVWAAFEEKAGGSVCREDVPCTVGTAVRIKDGFLEYICIGDCSLLVRYQDGTVEEFLDNTICGFDKNSINMAVEISKKEGIPVSQCRPRILPELRRVRMTMNTPEGYISLADNPHTVLKAISGKIPLSQIKDVCMVSDGFSEYYNMLHLADSLEAFMDAAKNTPHQELFDTLLSAQRADEALEKYPRFKLSDDATILYFSL